MQRSKTALVLAGGGVAGAVYEIGALCAIDDLLTTLSVNDFDIYVGTSAGGLIASCLVNGITPRTILASLEGSIHGIEQLEPQHLFSFNLSDTLSRSMRLPSALFATLRQLISEGSHASVLEIFETLAVGLPPGLYDNMPLHHYLHDVLSQAGRTNDFRELKKELAIIATDLDDGERAIFGQPPLDHVPISLAVCASAAIPLLYWPVRIDGHDYSDGGIRGTASLDLAIERGASLIVCINPMVPFDKRSYAHNSPLSNEGVQRIGNQVFRTFVHAGLHYHLKQIRRRHPEIDIILIEPRRDDPVMYAENLMRYRTRLAIARHGFESVAQHLTEHFGYYQGLLSRHNIRISVDRVRRTLQALQQAGNDPLSLQDVLNPGHSPHVAPNDLSHTLAELDRILERMTMA
jgi:predicted acylesterase/phospholipase RssA